MITKLQRSLRPSSVRRALSASPAPWPAAWGEASIGPPLRFDASDGVELKYTDTNPSTAWSDDRPTIVFLHGWSANGSYFSHNVPALRDRFRCVTLDHRGMGDSAKPGHGHRVSRLSADVRDLLEHLQLESTASRVHLCGCSLGFTIIMGFLELFENDMPISSVSFVDQSAAMFHKAGWNHGSPGLSNPAMLADLQVRVCICAYVRTCVRAYVRTCVLGGRGGRVTWKRPFTTLEISSAYTTCTPLSFDIRVEYRRGPGTNRSTAS